MWFREWNLFDFNSLGIKYLYLPLVTTGFLWKASIYVPHVETECQISLGLLAVTSLQAHTNTQGCAFNLTCAQFMCSERDRRRLPQETTSCLFFTILCYFSVCFWSTCAKIVHFTCIQDLIIHIFRLLFLNQQWWLACPRVALERAYRRDCSAAEAIGVHTAQARVVNSTSNVCVARGQCETAPTETPSICTLKVKPTKLIDWFMDSSSCLRPQRKKIDVKIHTTVKRHLLGLCNELFLSRWTWEDRHGKIS